MPLPVFAIPLALSAIKALLKYRRRIDEILSTKETTAELPFILPPASVDDMPYWNDIVQYFEPKEGELKDDAAQALLFVKNLQTDYENFANAVKAGNKPDFETRQKLYKLYCEACGKPVQIVGPGYPAAYLDTGSSPDMILAYYVVSSQRLSQNPAVTRIILATADTLLR